MKANELMIGDLVKIKDGFPIKMQDVSGTSMFRRWSSDGEIMIPYGWDEIEPIPLTWDILYKNFPDTDDGLAWWENTEFENDAKDEYLWWHITVTGDVLVVDGEIRYVHELQHALRLCGIEKEIEL